jgi:hypothetical protein
MGDTDCVVAYGILSAGSLDIGVFGRSSGIGAAEFNELAYE